MKQTPAGWTVLDHEAGVLSLTYEFARHATSNCFATRMGNGQMLVISPSIALSDAAADELLQYGEVGALLVNNGFHYLGQAAWQKRFPKARRFAAPEAVKRITSKTAVLGSFEPLSALAELAGPNIGVREVPNTKCGESWCWVKTPTGYVWYVSDVLINLPSLPPSFLPRMLFKLSKSAPGFRVFSLSLAFTVRDKRATLQSLLNDMKGHEPGIVVPAHGAILSGSDIAAQTLALIQRAA